MSATDSQFSKTVTAHGSCAPSPGSANESDRLTELGWRRVPNLCVAWECPYTQAVMNQWEAVEVERLRHERNSPNDRISAFTSESEGSGGVRFTRDDAQKASDEWGFNCGPGALCAVLGMTPSELRPHMRDFEVKGYTNPTLMLGVLDGLGVSYRQMYRGDAQNEAAPWPGFGLVRVQWAGPWTKPGVPMRVRYRQTHWVGVRTTRGFVTIFDVNAMCVGGWLSFQEWANELVPWLIRECVPKGSGDWWPTHGLEVGGGGGSENAETRSRAGCGEGQALREGEREARRNEGDELLAPRPVRPIGGQP